MRSVAIPLQLLAIACVLIVGCNNPAVDSVVDAVDVKGTLTMNGQPLQVVGREIGTGMVSLTFIPVAATPADQQTFSTTVNEEGKFDLPGGIPAGEYRVAVRQWEPYPQTDKLAGKYDEQTTPLKVTINGRDPLTIELP